MLQFCRLSYNEKSPSRKILDRRFRSTGQLLVIASLLISLVLACAPVKIGLFRGVMKVIGGKVYKSRFIALYNPKFLSAEEAGYLRDDEEVIGISFNGIAKAYPLTMSFYHHIFNDEINGRRILVTFCPLTHTAMVFDPYVTTTRPLHFTVDGLKESNMIMLDDSTASEWVQITGEAIHGKMKGKKLDLLSGLHTTWVTWRQLYPKTLVLSRETGFDYDYSQFPFQEKYFKYKKSDRFLFKVSHRDDRYHPKELILGVMNKGVYKAYPFSILPEVGVINDIITDTPIAVIFDKKNQTIVAFSRQFDGDVLEFHMELDANGLTIKDCRYGSSWDFAGIAREGPCQGRSLQPVKSFKAFWFAWISFFPQTMVWSVLETNQ